MNKFRRFPLSVRLYRKPEPGEDGAGAASPAPAQVAAAETAAAPAPAAPAPTPAPTTAPAESAAAPATDGAAAPAPAAEGAPKTLLEAIQSASKDKPTEAPKPVILGADGKPLLPETEKKAGEEAVKPDAEKADDVTSMPDGLAPKAQQRFQKLVETNKEVTQRAERLEQAQEYFVGALREHRISQPQFELAAKTVGMINNGDYDGAMKVLQEQLQQVAVLAGRTVPNIDTLAGHADLREAVNNLELSEARATEIASARANQQLTQQRAQRQQVEQQQAVQQQQTVQAEQAKVQQATLEVDQLCRKLQSSDLDFARIEQVLLPQIADLVVHLPPAQWAAAVQRQYNMLKSVGAPARTSAPAGTLRPGGADNPQAQPSSLHEAMWGKVRPA